MIVFDIFINFGLDFFHTRGMRRCDFCKKKTHLEFKCGCLTGQPDKIFCVSCRATEVHKCGVVFDVVKLDKIEAKKVDKI